METDLFFGFIKTFSAQERLKRICLGASLIRLTVFVLPGSFRKAVSGWLLSVFSFLTFPFWSLILVRFFRAIGLYLSSLKTFL